MTQEASWACMSPIAEGEVIFSDTDVEMSVLFAGLLSHFVVSQTVKLIGILIVNGIHVNGRGGHLKLRTLGYICAIWESEISSGGALIGS